MPDRRLDWDIVIRFTTSYGLDRASVLIPFAPFFAPFFAFDFHLPFVRYLPLDIAPSPRGCAQPWFPTSTMRCACPSYIMPLSTKKTRQTRSRNSSAKRQTSRAHRSITRFLIPSGGFAMAEESQHLRHRFAKRSSDAHLQPPGEALIPLCRVLRDSASARLLPRATFLRPSAEPSRRQPRLSPPLGPRLALHSRPL